MGGCLSHPNNKSKRSIFSKKNSVVDDDEGKLKSEDVIDLRNLDEDNQNDITIRDVTKSPKIFDILKNYII